MTASPGPDIPCREGIPEYDVTWPWHAGTPEPGLTCVFRVKNEARNLPWVLPPMFQAVQRVVLVDNLSDDETGQVGHDVAEECGALDRYQGLGYPFRVSRAGAEHRETPADSVHSLTHFYNWSFSHVRTAYSMKWDGDMVLTADGIAALRDLSWQLEGSEAVVVVPRHPLTVVDERTGWLDLGKSYLEPWIYPMGPDYTFVKAFEWEVREWPETAERIVLPDGLAVELKWLDADEFAHWTDPSQFNAQRSPRKLREWQVDRAIREGRPGDIDGLVEVVAPPGVHIVDHVVSEWLPRAERPLVGRSRPAAAPVATGQAASEPGRTMDPLQVALRNAAQPVLGLVHPDSAHLVPRLPEGTTVVQLPTESVPDTGRWGTIVLVVPDRDALQRAVATLPATRATRNVGVFLEYADEVVTLTPRDDWPRMTMMSTRRDRHEYVTVARFSNWMAGKAVLSEFARQAVRRGLTPHTGLRVGVHGGAVAPPGEVHAIRLDELDAASDADRDVPPDVIVTDQADVSLKEHHVTGRAPVVVDETSGALAIGALEERILHPTGFERSVSEPVGTLTSGETGPVLRLPGRELATSARRGASEEMVHAVRPHLGVEVSWPEEPEVGLARTVAGLAMAGVPIVSAATPGWAQGLLGGEVCTALAAPVELADELAREEHSVVLRRAALAAFSMPAWRSRVAAGAGLRPPYSPSVSVVVASKRADNLEHLLAQVSRQRGVDLELVLAPHGWEADRARVADLAGGHVRTVVSPHPEETLFGDVLAAAVEAASGDLVLKMDDDDWYGPDFVTDLLLARGYSGADLVGMPAEYLYLEPLDTTVRRNDGSEEFGRFVAGGTMMISRATLRELGSFRPVRRYVDASLLSDLLAAGGSVYRTQGLGYLFRRGSTGHTWEADLDFFLDPERLRSRWDGFRPSRLLEAEADRAPTGGTSSEG